MIKTYKNISNQNISTVLDSITDHFLLKYFYCCGLIRAVVVYGETYQLAT